MVTLSSRTQQWLQSFSKHSPITSHQTHNEGIRHTHSSNAISHLAFTQQIHSGRRWTLSDGICHTALQTHTVMASVTWQSLSVSNGITNHSANTLQSHTANDISHSADSQQTHGGGDGHSTVTHTAMASETHATDTHWWRQTHCIRYSAHTVDSQQTHNVSDRHMANSRHGCQTHD